MRTNRLSVSLTLLLLYTHRVLLSSICNQIFFNPRFLGGFCVLLAIIYLKFFGIFAIGFANKATITAQMTPFARTYGAL